MNLGSYPIELPRRVESWSFSPEKYKFIIFSMSVSILIIKLNSTWYFSSNWLREECIPTSLTYLKIKNFLRKYLNWFSLSEFLFMVALKSRLPEPSKSLLLKGLKPEYSLSEASKLTMFFSQKYSDLSFPHNNFCIRNILRYGLNSSNLAISSSNLVWSWIPFFKNSTVLCSHIW